MIRLSKASSSDEGGQRSSATPTTSSERTPSSIDTCSGSFRTAARLVLTSLLAAACVDTPVTTPTELAPDPSMAVAAATAQVAPRFAQGQILVEFLPGANRSSIGAAHSAVPQREIGPGVWLTSVPAGQELAIATALSQNPQVAFAEPDYMRVFGDPLCPTCSVPNDQLFEWVWNMHNDGLIEISPLFTFATGSVDADIDWLEAYDQPR